MVDIGIKNHAIDMQLRITSHDTVVELHTHGMTQVQSPASVTHGFQVVELGSSL